MRANRRDPSVDSSVLQSALQIASQHPALQAISAVSISMYIVRFYKNTTFGFVAEIATGLSQRKKLQHINISSILIYLSKFTGRNCLCGMLSFRPGDERGVVQADRDFALLYGKG